MNEAVEKFIVDNRADPIDILMREHERALKYIQSLSMAAKHIEANGFSFEAFGDISEAIRFINVDIRHHNEKEEKYLFPLMDIHVDGPPNAMRDEHRELWKAFNALMECVKDVEELRIYPTTVKDLIHNSNVIVELLTDHITKENNILFPMAKQVLTKEEYIQLSENIRK